MLFFPRTARGDQRLRRYHDLFLPRLLEADSAGGENLPVLWMRHYRGGRA